MNSGSVSSAYHFISFIAALKASSEPPVPHRSSAKTTAMKPIAPNTRWPVSRRPIIPANIRIAVIS